MRWYWRILAWLGSALMAMSFGAEIGSASYDCPADAADCDLGILWAYGGAFYGLLVVVGLAFLVEVTLLARWLLGRREPAPTGESVSA